MKTLLHSGASRLLTLIYALALSGILPACTDDADRDLPDKGKGGTVTLELSLSVPPMVETKAVICEADSGSEARKAGFYYEMQVQTTDTTGNAGGHVATKAATSLKNIYAFLFKISDGKFNGRASLEGPVDLSKKLMLAFSGVTDVDSRLVIIANDAAGADYKSSTNFDSFTGTYAEFQKLTLESDITKDEDIPYVGSTTVSLDDGYFTLADAVPLYRMLAKIVLHNDLFEIDNGPARDSINLHNAGNKYFGTPNGYDGAGDTQTTSGRLTTVTVGKNEKTNTWYVGDNVQSKTDSTNAAYIELKTAVIDKSNTTPKVGEEYIIDRAAFKYKVYLKDYALRRNNVYTVRVNVSGDLAFHQTLASTTGSNVSKESTVDHGGLNIGMFGGAEGYTAGSGSVRTITGSYTKNLLIQPNTSGTTEMDLTRRYWGTKGTRYQTEARKYWDYTYIKSITTGGLVGGMGVVSSYVYEYCYELTIGGVSKGTWYPPTNTQLQSIWTVLANMQNSYYSNFYKNDYLSSTENNENTVRGINFSTGGASKSDKEGAFRVRCVRDLSVSSLSAQFVTETSDGYPAIDLSALEPLGAVLSSAEADKRRTDMNEQTPSKSAFLQPVGSTVSDHNGTWNATMSIKYQVMQANQIPRTDWTSAWNACKEYSGEGGAAGTWRLPTQRELQMILILQPQLIGKGGFTAFEGVYCWSATEVSESTVWCVHFNDADVQINNKSSSYQVRCVRDL